MIEVFRIAESRADQIARKPQDIRLVQSATQTTIEALEWVLGLPNRIDIKADELVAQIKPMGAECPVCEGTGFKKIGGLGPRRHEFAGPVGEKRTCPVCGGKGKKP